MRPSELSGGLRVFARLIRQGARPTREREPVDLAEPVETLATREKRGAGLPSDLLEDHAIPTTPLGLVEGLVCGGDQL